MNARDLAVNVLTAIVAGTLLYACWIIFFPPAEVSRWSLLPPIAICSGVLVALLAFARDRDKLKEEGEKHQSRILFERASLGFEAVVSMLSDQNNDRLTWIRAARTLQRAIDLGERIADKSYRLTYELEADKTRLDLYLALTEKDSEGSRVPLAPQFFYGVSDWKRYETLDEAAIAASHWTTGGLVTLDKNFPVSNLKPLSEKSIVAIYNFIEFPKDYKDPLDGFERWDDNWEDRWGADQGARRYIVHARLKTAHNGQLFDNKPADTGS